MPGTPGQFPGIPAHEGKMSVYRISSGEETSVFTGERLQE